MWIYFLVPILKFNITLCKLRKLFRCISLTIKRMFSVCQKAMRRAFVSLTHAQHLSQSLSVFLRIEFTDSAPNTANRFGIVLWRKALPIHLSRNEMLCISFPDLFVVCLYNSFRALIIFSMVLKSTLEEFLITCCTWYSLVASLGIFQE